MQFKKIDSMKKVWYNTCCIDGLDDIVIQIDMELICNVDWHKWGINSRPKVFNGTWAHQIPEESLSDWLATCSSSVTIKCLYASCCPQILVCFCDLYLFGLLFNSNAGIEVIEMKVKCHAFKLFSDRRQLRIWAYIPESSGCGFLDLWKLHNRFMGKYVHFKRTFNFHLFKLIQHEKYK